MIRAPPVVVLKCVSLEKEVIFENRSDEAMFSLDQLISFSIVGHFAWKLDVLISSLHPQDKNALRLFL